MKNVNYSSALLIITSLLIGLFCVMYLCFKPYEQKVVKTNNHSYDYIIEVKDGYSDSTLLYELYDDKHNLVEDSLTARQLDSIIISDNL
jgi:cell division protein YceG involved in septum cleavage